ncbi:hypothetical protein [Dyadobacter sp. CY343]|uniref:hypothetical protein n=1 Tax=Dyadobacter sp. CY343 TaxID=2907299 RepID=UPI001F2D54F9|nr:hypothetical protein [Dyadobacter sp. CY343]MCE7063212.1 hypothetical protein [Dyadobacter sp. CY343]
MYIQAKSQIYPVISSVNPFRELHSDEMQEIVGAPPHWILTWGISAFFGMLLILFAVCWFIRYPDIVPARISLTAFEAPRTIVVRSEGKLDRLLIKDGQQVLKGQSLAFTESTADHEQVLNLSQQLTILENFQLSRHPL